MSKVEVRTIFCREMWTVSLDFKDAYWHMPIHSMMGQLLVFLAGRKFTHHSDILKAKHSTRDYY